MRAWSYSLFLLAVICAKSTAMPSNPCTTNKGDISVKEGRLLVNGWTQLPHVSLSADCGEYVFVYIPDKGLLTFAMNAFPGASVSGSTTDDRISIHSGGLDVEIISDSSGVKKQKPVWATFEGNFRIDQVDQVVIGTGSDIKNPYRWTHDKLFR